MDADPLNALPEHLRGHVRHIASITAAVGGAAYMVGGSVRDALIGLPVKDVDIEVFGLAPEKLRATLRHDYNVIEVGASFGVLKLRGLEIDVSIPRRESKTSPGHKGFAVVGDPAMSLTDAAARRDFTINAIYHDIRRARTMDPLGGLADLATRTLRHCGPAFGDDPLRVLRAMQFIARFGLRPTPETIEVCASMDMEDLPAERLFEEWKKLLLKGRDMSAGLEFLRDCGWIRHFPELEALCGCKQDPVWHPEGDAWTHTLRCLDAYTELRTGDEYEDTILGLAVLCHDMGKPLTTFVDENGRIRAFGHEAAGEAPARAFLGRLTRQKQLVEDVVALVRTHMQPASLHKNKAGQSAIRRLALRVRIDRLVRLARADMRGTPPKPHDEAPCDWLLAEAAKLDLHKNAPKPIVQGRHLISLGLKPGPHLGALLDRLFEAQLEGEFHDEQGGVEAARWLIAKSSAIIPQEDQE